MDLKVRGATELEAIRTTAKKGPESFLSSPFYRHLLRRYGPILGTVARSLTLAGPGIHHDNGRRRHDYQRDSEVKPADDCRLGTTGTLVGTHVSTTTRSKRLKGTASKPQTRDRVGSAGVTGRTPPSRRSTTAPSNLTGSPDLPHKGCGKHGAVMAFSLVDLAHGRGQELTWIRDWETEEFGWALHATTQPFRRVTRVPPEQPHWNLMSFSQPKSSASPKLRM